MGRSDQYKQRKKAFTQKKRQNLNGDELVDLNKRPTTSSKSNKKKKKQQIKEECFSESSTTQPDSDNSSNCTSMSEQDNDLKQSEAAIAKQQQFNKNDKLKIVMWDLQQCDPKKCSGRKLVRHNLMKVLQFKK